MFGNIGSVSKKSTRNISVFSVTSLNQILTKIIPHFDIYPLMSQKKADYLLFKKVALLIKQKQHLTEIGFQEIINYRASINLGLSPKLKNAFPLWKPIIRPVINNQEMLDPYWVAGFTSGEGNFLVNLRKDKTGVSLRFKLIQHSRDNEIIKKLVAYFDCGYIYENPNSTIFQVERFSDISNKIIPFFKKYLILGVKYYDFADLCKVEELMREKKHLTALGLNDILIIKQGINKGRSL